MRFLEQRRRAFDVDRRIRPADPRTWTSPAAWRGRAARRRAAAPDDALEHGLARAMQRQAGELGVEVVGGVVQVVGVQVFGRRRSTFWMTCPPRATMTTSTRAPPSGMNSTRSNTAASWAGRIANPMWPEACETMCETCGSSESSKRRRTVAPQPRLDGARHRGSTASSRAAGRRKSGSRGRSESGRQRYEAAGRSLRPRVARECCGPSPTRRRAPQPRRAGRRDRLARRDVLAHEGRQQTLRPILRFAVISPQL